MGLSSVHWNMCWSPIRRRECASNHEMRAIAVCWKRDVWLEFRAVRGGGACACVCVCVRACAYGIQQRALEYVLVSHPPATVRIEPRDARHRSLLGARGG